MIFGIFNGLRADVDFKGGGVGAGEAPCPGPGPEADSLVCSMAGSSLSGDSLPRRLKSAIINAKKTTLKITAVLIFIGNTLLF
jgi:hypothetical protein